MDLLHLIIDFDRRGLLNGFASSIENIGCNRESFLLVLIPFVGQVDEGVER